ncbi:hypothetical protein AGOR_G00074590 [Albula goreensis]|uniref:Uncharacterized protein n=1 Tax=Albula goreensis TaxID=1534307 RepID=A0A8T3DN47_9TELE|nr:hypothetical protein AGOR_G00074590 [Albula goreensis]
MPGCVVSATSGLAGPVNLSGSLGLWLAGSSVSSAFFSELREMNWLMRGYGAADTGTVLAVPSALSILSPPTSSPVLMGSPPITPATPTVTHPSSALVLSASASPRPCSLFLHTLTMSFMCRKLAAASTSSGGGWAASFKVPSYMKSKSSPKAMGVTMSPLIVTISLLLSGCSE